MRALGNGIQNFYGQLTIQAPTAGGSGLTVNGIGGSTFANPAVRAVAPNTASISNGLFITAGTNSSDASFLVQQANGSTNTFVVYGDGGVVVGAPAGGDQGFCSINASSLLVAGNGVFAGMPVNTYASAHTLILADANHGVLMSTTGGVTIPANSVTAFPVGTIISIANFTGSAQTISINTDTLFFTPSGTTGSRTLAAVGQATLVKWASTTWFISGTGLT